MLMITIIIISDDNSVIYLSAYSAAQRPIIKSGRAKEGNKTHKQETKQGNLCHLDNNTI
jgi:hypothetical protein